MGIVPSKSFTGNSETSATDLRYSLVSEINLKLNGNAVHGYPMKINNNYPIWPYVKYNYVTNRMMNVDCSGQTTIDNFKNNMIYAHKFEAEETSQGWISLNITLNSLDGYTEPHSFGKNFISYYFFIILIFSCMVCS